MQSRLDSNRQLIEDERKKILLWKRNKKIFMCLNLILKRVNSQQQCGNHSPNCLLDLYTYLD